MNSEILSDVLGAKPTTLPICLSDVWSARQADGEDIRKCIHLFAMLFRDREFSRDQAKTVISDWWLNEEISTQEVDEVYSTQEPLTCALIKECEQANEYCECALCDYPAWHRDLNFVKLEKDKQAKIKEKFEPSGPIEDDSKKKDSITTKLTRLVKSNCKELWHTPSGQTYITLNLNGHLEHKPINSKSVRAWLSRLASDFLLETVSITNLKSVVLLLEGIALYDGKEYPMYVRKAEHEGKIYVDIGEQSWKVIEISGKEWKIVEECPVRFFRPKSLLPLPMPETGGNIDDFKQLVNITDADNWVRFTAWLSQAFWCKGPYVHLHIRGPQGSAKSGLAENTKAIIDPSRAPKRHLPKSSRELMMAGQNEAIPSFDNVSDFSDEIADTICIMSTGGSSAARELYTDSEESIIYSKNPIIMNGIADPSQRGDLIDRLMILDLESISEDDRVSEKEMQRRMAEYGPKLLGVLLDATVTGLQNVENVVLKTSPRMADFTQWAISCSGVLGWEPENFVSIYQLSRNEAQDDMAQTNLLMQAIRRFSEAHPDGFEGTSTELLNILNKQEYITPGHEPDDWPRKAQLMGTAVRRLVQPAKTQCVDIKFIRKGGKNLISIQKQETVQADLGVGFENRVHNENDSGVTCVPCVSFSRKRTLYRKEEKGTRDIKEKVLGFEPTQPTQDPPIAKSDEMSLPKPTRLSLHVGYVLKEIAKFVGIDGLIYGPFRPDEVVSMPEIHAANLAKGGFLRQLSS